MVYTSVKVSETATPQSQLKQNVDLGRKRSRAQPHHTIPKFKRANYKQMSTNLQQTQWLTALYSKLSQRSV